MARVERLEAAFSNLQSPPLVIPVKAGIQENNAGILFNEYRFYIKKPD